MAPRDRFQVAQRMKDPIAQEARSHRSQSAVDGAAQTGSLGVAGLDQLEIGLRDGIEKHVSVRVPWFRRS